MSTSIFVVVVLLNVALAVLCTWQIQEKFPRYYEEIGSPNYGVSGPGMFMFMFGHVLVFRYLAHTRGVLRVALILWTVVLWALVIGIVTYLV